MNPAISQPRFSTLSASKTSGPDVSWESLLKWSSVHVEWRFTESQRAKVKESYARLMQVVRDSPSPIYGIHTGFGADISERVVRSGAAHQADLLEYLCVGVGPALSEGVVRRALRLQAYKTALGFSGVSYSTFAKLVSLSNSDAMPIVPSYGSLGASGDLISMAHAVRSIFEESDGVVSPETIEGPRDVLSLVNTNSVMASLGIDYISQSESIILSGAQITALNSDSMGFGVQHFSGNGIDLPGQDPWVVFAAETLVEEVGKNRTLNGVSDSSSNLGRDQARYSIRCAPQVIGGSFWSLAQAQNRLHIEALRVADNPVVLPEGLPIWHGGHFYALPIAQAADLAADAIYRICEMLDRQVLLLMIPETSGGLPRNLEVSGYSHLKGIHQLISSLLQRMRGLSTPSRIMSFSCEGNNQDIVPCGMNALHQLGDLIQLADEVIRATKFVADRAFRLRNGQGLDRRHSLESWRSP